MQVKEVPPISFLFFRTEAQINTLTQFLPVSQELYKEAVKNKIPITGPVHWHYHSFTGGEQQAFTLEIALPVAYVLEEYDGNFHFKRTGAFKCLALVHEGNWLDFPRSYDVAFHYIADNKLEPLAVNREIYINVDFKHPEANVSEIQIGLK